MQERDGGDKQRSEHAEAPPVRDADDDGGASRSGGSDDAESDDYEHSGSAASGDASTRPLRALFFHGLPRDDATIAMSRGAIFGLVRRLLPQQCSADDAEAPLWRVHFSRTIHRKIRHGAFLVIFETVDAARAAWRQCCESPSRVDAAAARVALCGQNGEGSDANPSFVCLAAEVAVRLPSPAPNVPQRRALTLTVSWSAGKLRDHFFACIPSAPLRRAFQLDPTGTKSLTDLPAALTMAGALLAVAALVKRRDPPDTIRVCDAFACCGGNTLGFLLHRAAAAESHPRVVDVTAVELDAGRAAMLDFNAALVRPLTLPPAPPLRTVRGCCVAFLASSLCAHAAAVTAAPARKSQAAFDVVFFDPPWGGAQYKDGDRFPLLTVDRAAACALSLASSPPSEGASEGAGDGAVAPPPLVDVTFEDLVAAIVAPTPHDASCHRVATVVAAKIPAAPWAEQWAQRLVERCVAPAVAAPHAPLERPFPFLMNFGASTRLLFFVRNAHVDRGTIHARSAVPTTAAPAAVAVAAAGQVTDAASALDGATNATLDGLVSALARFNEGDGCRELCPRFFDFEKRRWILLKKWRGSKAPPDATVG
jgi:hypothetical protein